MREVRRYRTHTWSIEYEYTEDISQAKGKTMSQRDGAVLYKICILKPWGGGNKFLCMATESTQEHL